MFYGWRIVIVAAFAQAVSSGTTYFSYGILLKPLADEFQASRLVSVLGLTLLILVQGLVSPVVGRALDRRSARGIMLTGVALHAVGLAAASLATALWQVGVLFATAIAIGSYLFGPLATATLVARWFVKHRGRALGWASLGAALGGFVFPPLVASVVELYGWRVAAGGLALVVLLLVFPIWLLVVSRPEDIGLSPDGSPAPLPDDSQIEITSSAQPITRLLRSRNFWCITASVGLAWAPVGVLLAHLVPYATDLGFAPAEAALLMSTYAGCSGAGRLILGSTADRLDKRVALWIALAVLAVGWFTLLGGPPLGRLLAASGLIGLAVGGLMPLWGALTGACFGRAHFGRAMGLMNPLMLPSNLAGGPIAAYLYDQSGSYALAFSLFLVPLALSVAIVGALRIPTDEPSGDEMIVGAS